MKVLRPIYFPHHRFARSLFTERKTLHENKNFCLTKICEKDTKDHIFISFRMFPFHGNIIFLNFPSKENVRKQHLSTSAYSCVNMKFLYMIAMRNDEIFYLILFQK